MKKNLNKVLCAASLSAFLCAGSANAVVALFALDSINTGVLVPGLLGGITINGQITYPNVFVYPAVNQKWFTTLRTCFNPMAPLANIGLNLPISEGATSGLSLPILGPITGTVTTLLGNGNIANLLSGLLSPLASSSMATNFTIYNDAGSVVRTLNNISIPANGCVTYTSDVTTDPLFGPLVGVNPGLYTVVVDAPLLQNLLGTNIGFLFGSANSTGRNVSFHEEMNKYYKTHPEAKI